mmetsp:Transcript_27116/g.67760  ORF Transcript_27116/g.67760 Transcript_27116/m.67760 type:complete len:252 (+) Transcript_27116:171-926(+)
MSIELENHQPDCKIAIGAFIAPPRGVGRGNPRAAARTLLDAFGSLFPPPSLVARLSLANSLLLHLLILLLREDPRHGNRERRLGCKLSDVPHDGCRGSDHLHPNLRGELGAAAHLGRTRNLLRAGSHLPRHLRLLWLFPFNHIQTLVHVLERPLQDAVLLFRPARPVFPGVVARHARRQVLRGGEHVRLGGDDGGNHQRGRGRVRVGCGIRGFGSGAGGRGRGGGRCGGSRLHVGITRRRGGGGGGGVLYR